MCHRMLVSEVISVFQESVLLMTKAVAGDVVAIRIVSSVPSVPARNRFFSFFFEVVIFVRL